MDFFKGKVCIVTGAARGIGKAIAESLLKRGARCLIGDILFKEGEETCSEFSSRYGAQNVVFFRLDVASHSSFELAFDRCKGYFGQDGVDVVVNNAGINGEANWESQVDINMKGTIRGCKLALRRMSRHGRPSETTGRGGVVLNVSSIQGLVSWPMMPTYSASKAAIVAYTRCAGHAMEHARSGVKILALCPFYVDTPMGDYMEHVGLTEVGEEFRSTMHERFTREERERLSAEEVAEKAMRVMEEGGSGSVWYLHAGGVEACEVPEGCDYERLLGYLKK